MALDSSGNIAVDFVWGNTPLQPDTERVDSTVEPFSALVAVEATGTGVYITAAAGLSSANFTPGDKVVISGTYTDWDGEYTVDFAQNGSPSGVTIGAPALSGSRAPLGVSGYPAVPAGALVTKSVSGNFGGGVGDKGWSKTTRKKSVKLDPALDGHNIATDFWNNFPGYIPNAGFIPQELFRFTSKPGSLYSWALNPDLTSDEYYSRGYSFRLTNSVITNEEIISLAAVAGTGALLAQVVPSFDVTDTYGNVTTVQEGFIAGVDVTPYNDVYAGGTSYQIEIKVAVPNFVPFNVNPLYPAAGTEVVLGVGEPKQIVATATYGVDVTRVAFTGGMGNPIEIYIYGTNWHTLDPNSFVGGYFATDALSDDPIAGMYLNKYFLNRNITKIESISTTDVYGQPLVDPYGNPYIRLTAADFTNESNGLNIWPATEINGTKIVVVK